MEGAEGPPSRAGPSREQAGAVREGHAVEPAHHAEGKQRKRRGYGHAEGRRAEFALHPGLDRPGEVAEDRREEDRQPPLRNTPSVDGALLRPPLPARGVILPDPPDRVAIGPWLEPIALRPVRARERLDHLEDVRLPPDRRPGKFARGVRSAPAGRPSRRLAADEPDAGVGRGLNAIAFEGPRSGSRSLVIGFSHGLRFQSRSGA